MKIRIAVGQEYENESGDEYEVLGVSDAGVKFKTSDGVFIHMDLDDVAADIEAGVLTLQEDVE